MAEPALGVSGLPMGRQSARERYRDILQSPDAGDSRQSGRWPVPLQPRSLQARLPLRHINEISQTSFKKRSAAGTSYTISEDCTDETMVLQRRLCVLEAEDAQYSKRGRHMNSRTVTIQASNTSKPVLHSTLQVDPNGGYSTRGPKDTTFDSPAGFSIQSGSARTRTSSRPSTYHGASSRPPASAYYGPPPSYPQEEDHFAPGGLVRTPSFLRREDSEKRRQPTSAQSLPPRSSPHSKYYGADLDQNSFLHQDGQAAHAGPIPWRHDDGYNIISVTPAEPLNPFDMLDPSALDDVEGTAQPATYGHGSATVRVGELGFQPPEGDININQESDSASSNNNGSIVWGHERTKSPSESERLAWLRHTGTGSDHSNTGSGGYVPSKIKTTQSYIREDVQYGYFENQNSASASVGEDTWWKYSVDPREPRPLRSSTSADSDEEYRHGGTEILQSPHYTSDGYYAHDPCSPPPTPPW